MKMIKLIFDSEYYEIFITRRNILVRNKLNNNHCHFSNLTDAIKFVRLMEKNIVPWSKYWKECKKRLEEGGGSSC